MPKKIAPQFIVAAAVLVLIPTFLAGRVFVSADDSGFDFSGTGGDWATGGTDFSQGGGSDFGTGGSTYVDNTGGWTDNGWTSTATGDSSGTGWSSDGGTTYDTYSDPALNDQNDQEAQNIQNQVNGNDPTTGFTTGPLPTPENDPAYNALNSFYQDATGSSEPLSVEDYRTLTTAAESASVTPAVALQVYDAYNPSSATNNYTPNGAGVAPAGTAVGVYHDPFMLTDRTVYSGDNGQFYTYNGLGGKIQYSQDANGNLKPGTVQTYGLLDVPSSADVASGKISANDFHYTLTANQESLKLIDASGGTDFARIGYDENHNPIFDLGNGDKAIYTMQTGPLGAAGQLFYVDAEQKTPNNVEIKPADTQTATPQKVVADNQAALADAQKLITQEAAQASHDALLGAQIGLRTPVGVKLADGTVVTNGGITYKTATYGDAFSAVGGQTQLPSYVPGTLALQGLDATGKAMQFAAVPLSAGGYFIAQPPNATFGPAGQLISTAANIAGAFTGNSLLTQVGAGISSNNPFGALMQIALSKTSPSIQSGVNTLMGVLGAFIPGTSVPPIYENPIQNYLGLVADKAGLPLATFWDAAAKAPTSAGTYAIAQAGGVAAAAPVPTNPYVASASTQLASVQLAGSSSSTPSVTVAKPVGSFASVSSIVQKLYNLGITAAGIIFIVLFLIGGIMYLGGAGDEKQTGKARRLMIDAAIGLFIVLSAWAVSNYVAHALGFPGF